MPCSATALFNACCFCRRRRGRRYARRDLLAHAQRRAGRPAEAQQALQALERGEAFEAELPLARVGAGSGDKADGPPQWYSLSVRRAQAEGGQVEAVAVLTDITRLKNLQAELEQLLRDRELMFSLSEVGIVYQRGARIERATRLGLADRWAAPSCLRWTPPTLRRHRAFSLSSPDRQHCAAGRFSCDACSPPIAAGLVRSVCAPSDGSAGLRRRVSARLSTRRPRRTRARLPRGRAHAAS